MARAKLRTAVLTGLGLVAIHSPAGPGIRSDNPMPARRRGRGWWPICLRVAQGVGDDRVMAEAAGVTFYALLAIFPAIAALISLYGLVADPSTIEAHLSGLAGVVPAGGMQIISEQVHSLAASGQKALGFGAVFGLLASVWSANAGMKSMFDALNAVYEEKEKRSFFRRTWLSLCFTLGALVFIILAIGAVVVLPAILDFLGLRSTTGLLLTVLRWPVLLVGIVIFLSLVYRYGPSRETATWRWIDCGSAFAALAWLGASLGFSYYVANFGNYNKTYGSLGAAIGFMTWIWISMIIVLTGGEVNAELERPSGC